MAKQPKHEASVTALLVAQDAFKDVRQRSHIHAIFDSLGSPSFPVSIPFVVYCRIVGQGTFTVLVRIIDSLEDVLIKSEPMTVEVTLQKGYELFLQFAVGFKTPGLYKVEAFVDGILQLETPLYVRHIPPPPATPPPPPQTQT